MSSSIQKYNHVNPTMNRKERRAAKRSRKRRAAIAMIAAGLLALSPSVSSDVIADVSDDLAIYGGGGGGAGASTSAGGGGGGYISYGAEYDFAGGNDGTDGATSYAGGGGGVGGGSRYQISYETLLKYYGGGNYLHDWGGKNDSFSPSPPGTGPHGIIGNDNGVGATSHSGLNIKFGISQVEGGNRENYTNYTKIKNGGSAKLSLTSNVTVNNMEILAGNSGDSYGPYDAGGTGGDATLDANAHQLTVKGDMIMASGSRGVSVNDNGASGGAVNTKIKTLYFTKGNHALKVVDVNAEDNVDIDVNTLDLANGAKLNASFLDSIEDVSFKSIKFRGEGSVTFNKNKGNFLPVKTYMSGIKTYNSNYTPSIKFTNNGNSMTITVTKKKVDNVTKIYTPNKTIYLKKGKSMTLPVKANATNTSSPKLTWSTNKEKVVTVTKSGKIKARRTGTAKITVKAANGKKMTIKVKVVKKSKKVKKIKIKGYKKSMRVGQTKYLTVKLNPKSATNGKIKFKSSKKSVINVDKAGKLTAKKKGKTKVTIKAGTKKKVITINVK